MTQPKQGKYWLMFECPVGFFRRFDKIRRAEGFTTRKAAIMRLLHDAVDNGSIMRRK